MKFVYIFAMCVGKILEKGMNCLRILMIMWQRRKVTFNARCVTEYSATYDYSGFIKEYIILK